MESKIEDIGIENPFTLKVGQVFTLRELEFFLRCCDFNFWVLRVDFSSHNYIVF
jgi:hypothetical protein